jgi:hypothetical protein
MARISHTAFQAAAAWNAIDGWYCEGDAAYGYYDYDNPKLAFGTMHGCGKDSKGNELNPDKVNGHFTQVV